MAGAVNYTDHLTIRSDVYDAAMDVDFSSPQSWWWDRTAVANFLTRPGARMGMVRAPEQRETFRSAWRLAVERILNRAHSICRAIIGVRTEYPIFVAAPSADKTQPREILQSLLLGLLWNIRPLVEYGVPPFDSKEPDVESELRALENIPGLRSPTAGCQEHCCLVVDIDRADCEETHGQVLRLIAALRRLFVEGEKGKVLFFVSTPYAIDGAEEANELSGGVSEASDEQMT